MRLTQWRDPLLSPCEGEAICVLRLASLPQGRSLYLASPSQGDKRGSVFYTRMTVSPFAACAP